MVWLIIAIVILVFVFGKYIFRFVESKKDETKNSGIELQIEPVHHCQIDDDPTNASISMIEMPDGKTLYITDDVTAKCPYIKRVFKIDSVLSITQRIIEKYPGFKGTHKHFQLDDLPTADISKLLDESNQFIDKQLADGKKLIVHCMAGISRSVSLVLSYMMHKYKLSFERALAIVRRNRSIACPNEGFVRQLRKKYENTGLGEVVMGIGKFN